MKAKIRAGFESGESAPNLSKKYKVPTATIERWRRTEKWGRSGELVKAAIEEAKIEVAEKAKRSYMEIAEATNERQMDELKFARSVLINGLKIANHALLKTGAAIQHNQGEQKRAEEALASGSTYTPNIIPVPYSGKEAYQAVALHGALIQNQQQERNNLKLDDMPVAHDRNDLDRFSDRFSQMMAMQETGVLDDFLGE